jgi:hypothetical protein
MRQREFIARLGGVIAWPAAGCVSYTLGPRDLHYSLVL